MRFAMTRFGLKARLAAAGAVALALAACDDRGGRVDAPEPAPLAELSGTEALPYAEPARVDYRAPAQGYAWAERAYGLQRAVYDTPPDYGFDYGDVEPLAWETEDDWAMYAEPWDDGYRYYYYEPGADYPYFVRDDDYGYGYGAGGVLVAVFDAGGRYLPVDTVYRVAPAAGRYYARGHDLRSAAHRARRIQVTDQAWAQRAPQVIRTADPWMRAARDDRQWRAWRDRDQDRELRRFEPEAARRAVRTRQWREQDDRREPARANADSWRQAAGIGQQQADRQRIGDAQRRDQAQREQRQQIEQRARGQRQQVEQQRRHFERQQADQQRQHVQQAEQQQRQQARQQHQQAEQQQRQQAHQQRQQVEQQQRQQAQQQRQQMEQQQRQQAHQQRQQMDQQRQQQAAQQRQPPQRPQPAQARSAEQQGQPAAGREHGGGQGQGQGKGRGRDRKD
jgi:hypothetical protein